MLVIYTRSTSIFTKEFWKWVARRIIRKYSGPNAVEDSLYRGLSELGVAFSRNKKPQTRDIAVVLSGAHALCEAIEYKKRGVIKKLIAGPNVMVNPKDYGSIMSSPEIDTILVPSEWVAEYWKLEAPEIAEKIAVWPAGVAKATAGDRSGSVIIYDKMSDAKLNEWIVETLAAQNVPYVVYTYGNFKQKDYLTALAHAPFLIYLSKSESQGLAIQEAWARNVPTFVIQSNTGTFDDRLFTADKINAPYLTTEMGAFFSSESELLGLIGTSKSFSPKEYCNTHLSDKSSVHILKNIYEKNN